MPRSKTKLNSDGVEASRLLVTAHAEWKNIIRVPVLMLLYILFKHILIHLPSSAVILNSEYCTKLFS